MKPTTSILSFGLRAAALTAFVIALGTWTGTGAHLGWTQTSIVKIQHDEITGIDYPVRHDAFVAGVELLAVGVAASAALAGMSFLPRLRRARVRA